MLDLELTIKNEHYYFEFDINKLKKVVLLDAYKSFEALQNNKRIFDLLNKKEIEFFEQKIEEHIEETKTDYLVENSHLVLLKCNL